MNSCDLLKSLNHLNERINADGGRLEPSVLDDVSGVVLENDCFSSSDCLIRRLSLELCQTVCLRMIVNVACGQEADEIKKYGHFAYNVLTNLARLSPQQCNLPCSGKFS